MIKRLSLELEENDYNMVLELRTRLNGYTISEVIRTAIRVLYIVTDDRLDKVILRKKNGAEAEVVIV